MGGSDHGRKQRALLDMVLESNNNNEPKQRKQPLLQSPVKHSGNSTVHIDTCLGDHGGLDMQQQG